MKLFIDANILVAVINKEYPLFTYASRVLSWASAKGYQLVTTSVSLAITYYFAEKKHGARSAKERIGMLAARFFVAECGTKEVQQAAMDKHVTDFEDGLQYFAAYNAGCTHIITENTRDFYFSILEVQTAYDFLKRNYKG
ncbi:PIN domain-containing protein [Niabella sp. CC-SYL272]|uniref:type II toxin-antitoxin system VapC family toxin n=1 Tax=Niabella agricola TaxID=2891571 RepID=UPI001F3A5DAB|nr:PIN domain-containing protein [Niabella agricola]MCF3108457.1 PIN domain-containing protein [Niabella agricola]